MPSGHKIGTIFAEIGMDFEPYTRAQKTLLKDATSTTTNIEKNFKNLGIKSATEFDLMRRKIANSYEMISKSGKASADDILRAEKAKNDQLKRLNEQQFGHQTSMMDSLKKNWLAYSAAAYAAVRMVGVAWGEIEKAADYKERVASLDALGAKYGTTGTQIVKSMQGAARGLISMAEAADMSAKALNLALTPEQMIEFTKVSEKLSDVIGGTVSESFDRMTIAAASGRLQTLAQMGILIDLNAEYKKHGDNLTEVQKQQIRLNAILDAAKAKTDELGESVDTERDKMDRLAKTSDDVKLAFGSIGSTITAAVLPALTNWAAGVRDITAAWAEMLEGPSTMDVLKKQEEDVLFKLGLARSAVVKDRGWLSTDEAFELAKQIPMLQKQLSIVRQTMVNEAAGVYVPKRPTPTGVMGGGAETPISSDLQKLIDAELQKFQIAKTEASKMEVFMMGNNERLVKMEQEARQQEMKALTDSVEYKQTVLQTDHTTALLLISELTEAEVKAADESVKLAAKKLQAESSYYNDMKDKAGDYYKFQLNALENERIEYIILTGNKAQADARYEAKKKDIDRAEMLRSNDFFGGIKVGYEQSLESAMTFAQTGKDVFDAFTSSVQSQMSDNFFNVFTGRMDELKWDWESMWDSMARTAADKLADIAVQKGLDAAITGIDWLGTAMGFWAEGAWDIKKDQMAVLHKGEMVVPADVAGNVRNELSLGKSWASEPLLSPATQQAVQDRFSGLMAGIGIGKLGSFLTTGMLNLGLAPATMFTGGLALAGTAIASEYRQSRLSQDPMGMGPGGMFGDYGDYADVPDFGDDPSSYLDKGGIMSGPKSGYKVRMHGTEAAVPLPDGRSIPVEIKGDRAGAPIYLINQGIITTDDVDSWLANRMTRMKENRVGTQYKTIDRSTAGLNI